MDGEVLRKSVVGVDEEDGGGGCDVSVDVDHAVSSLHFIPFVP